MTTASVLVGGLVFACCLLVCVGAGVFGLSGGDDDGDDVATVTYVRFGGSVLVETLLISVVLVGVGRDV